MYHLRGYIYHNEQNGIEIGTLNVLLISDKNEEHIGNGRKDNYCYKVAKNLAELCSSALWKVELMSYYLGYLAEVISQQQVFKICLDFSLLFRVKSNKRKIT